MGPQSLQIGVARTRLSPPWGVELSGWGYYLGRTWQRVRDHTAATALVLDDGHRAVAIVEHQGRRRGVIADALPRPPQVVAPAGQLDAPRRRQPRARHADLQRLRSHTGNFLVRAAGGEP